MTGQKIRPTKLEFGYAFDRLLPAKQALSVLLMPQQRKVIVSALVTARHALDLHDGAAIVANGPVGQKAVDTERASEMINGA